MLVSTSWRVPVKSLLFYSFLCTAISKPAHCLLVSFSHFSEQTWLWTKVEQTGGHAYKMDNTIFGGYALALSQTFIFGLSRSLFSLQKSAIYWAPVARTVNYLWQLLMCVCVSVWSIFQCICVCFHLHITSRWDQAVSSTISPVRQDNNDISVNPLLPSLLPGLHPNWQ